MQFALHELDGVSTPSGDGHREHKRERERKAGEEKTTEEVAIPAHAGATEMIGFFEKRSGREDVDPGFFDEKKRGSSAYEAALSPGFFDEEKRWSGPYEIDMAPGFFADDKRAEKQLEVGPGFFTEDKRWGYSPIYEPGFFDEEEKRGGRGRRYEKKAGYFPGAVSKRLGAGRTFQLEPGFFEDVNEEKRMSFRHGSTAHHKRHSSGHHKGTVNKL